MPPVESPCISVCNMNADTALCEGCWRTLDEIAGWSVMSDDEKRAALTEVRARKEEAAGQAPASLPPGIRFIQRDWLSCNQILMCDTLPVQWPKLPLAVALPEGGSRYTLIDSGYGKHRQMTLSLVQYLIGPGKLERILNTHLHSDHCGGNALLAEKTGCKIFVPAASFRDVQAWDTEALTYGPTGQSCPRFEATGALKAGDTFTAGGLLWEIHAAPGHDPKSFIFFAPAERLLISADALWENGFGILFPELEGESAYQEQKEVLDLIEALNPRLVLPGHGAMFSNVGEALAKARSRLAALMDKPERNARNALRALAKFALLDREKMSFDDFVAAFGHTAINQACARQLGQPVQTLLRQALLDLAAIGAARIEGEIVHNHDEKPA